MIRHLLIALCLLLALAACGRKGALEPPPGTQPAQPDQVDPVPDQPS